MSLSYKVKGDWKNTEKWLNKGLTDNFIIELLNEMGKKGVKALEEATPKRTGLTSRSWRYAIEKKPKGYTLYWTNDNKTKNGDMIAVLLQYGHGTGRGGYVKGIDYINPALKNLFNDMAEEIDKAVMNL